MNEKDWEETENSQNDPEQVDDVDTSLGEFPEAHEFSMDGKGKQPPIPPQEPSEPEEPVSDNEAVSDTPEEDVPEDIPLPEDDNPPAELAWKPVYAMDDSPQEPEKPKKKHRGLKIGLIVAGCVLVVSAGAVAGGCYYILNDGGAFDAETFYANTYINGIDCSGMTVDEVYSAITEDLGTYSLTIVERNGSEVITGSDIDLAERPDRAAIQEVLDSQNSASKLSLIQQYYGQSESEITLIRSYDEEKATACIDALTCLDTSQMVAPVDAELVRGVDSYYITESVLGTTLDADTARTIIEDALANYEETVDLEALGLYSSPSVTETDESLTSQLAQIETLLSASITYNFSDRTYTCDNTVIIDFLIQDEEGNWTVDEDLVHAWVDQMAEETDTYQDHTFTTHSGSTVYLPNGNYGWSLYRDTTTEELVEKIKAGSVEFIEPNYYHSNAKTRATNDIGDDYVEVDLTNQKVYLYVDGECILTSDCVSGLASDSERATPSWGVWALSYKKSPATLGTMEVQGYESDVTYWMPFNGGVGLHDASWRSSFGGSIYKTNGSHGCINLPLSAAKTIYENISAGWPIIVYGE